MITRMCTKLTQQLPPAIFFSLSCSSLSCITQLVPLGDDITPPLVLLSQIQILTFQMERSHNQAKP